MQKAKMLEGLEFMSWNVSLLGKELASLTMTNQLFCIGNS
jgi:hypothetical protein